LEAVKLEFKFQNIFKGSRFLITGGAGFIGSNLCEAILKGGHFVRCLDNFSTGKRKNIEPFLSYSNFELYEGDIRDLDFCMNACEGIDYVSHQAAWGSVPRSIEKPIFYEDVNIKGTLNMLEAAKMKNIKKFVYASSSSVYGDEPNLPKKEGREGNLLSPYAVTKHTNEQYAKLYFKLYHLPTIGLRYFNVFGRRQDPDGAYAAVIPKFINALIKGKSPVINGDGLQSRDFTYIENVIEANLRAFIALDDANGQVFNIAYGDQIRLLDMYNLIARMLLKENIHPNFAAERQGDIKHSCADISKAKELLGYKPIWNFERGIADTIEWYQQSPFCGNES